MATFQTSLTDFFRKKDKKKRKAADEDTEGPRKISSDPPRDGEIDDKKHKSNEPTPEAPPAPAKASPFSFGGWEPAAKPAAAPKRVFSIFDSAKPPPPTQDFKAPPYQTLTDSQREGLTAEYKKDTRLDARRKKTLAKTYEVESEKKVGSYWEKIRKVDPSYVKTKTWTKPEVAPGVPAHGDLPVDALTAIKGAYDEDTSLSAERAKTLAQEHKIKPELVERYWEKLKDLDPDYERQTYIVDGRSDERKKAKQKAEREAQRDARLLAKHQLGVVEPSTKARL